jgi:hypothetical protein
MDNLIENVNELQNQKGMLLSEILELIKEKEKLDTIIKNHEALQIKDAELLKSIESRGDMLLTIDSKLNPLLDLKESLTKECDKLQVTLEEKRILDIEIKKGINAFKILQNETNEYEVKKTQLKIDANEKVKSTKETLELLKESITNTLNKL